MLNVAISHSRIDSKYLVEPEKNRRSRGTSFKIFD